MSYIFEALQRAEAERAGANVLVHAESAADLLQQTEQRAESAPSQEQPKQLTDPTTAAQFADARVLVPTMPDPRLVCLTDQGSLAAEKFRVLGLKLRGLRDRRKLNRIVVTGTAPQEGKSLVAANLALNQGRSRVFKTLLVDGDLRRPTVATRFGFDRFMPGLSECLRGELALPAALYRIKDSNLWLLPSGVVPENPLEAMQSGHLAELLEQLASFFDWVIIDTPPVIPVADTAFWIRHADGALVVVREGVSEMKVVEKAMEAMDSASVLGIVFNSCTSSDHQYYYSHYSQSVEHAGEHPPTAPAASER